MKFKCNQTIILNLWGNFWPKPVTSHYHDHTHTNTRNSLKMLITRTFISPQKSQIHVNTYSLTSVQLHGIIAEIFP